MRNLFALFLILTTFPKEIQLGDRKIKVTEETYNKIQQKIEEGKSHEEILQHLKQNDTPETEEKEPHVVEENPIEPELENTEQEQETKPVPNVPKEFKTENTTENTQNAPTNDQEKEKLEQQPTETNIQPENGNIDNTKNNRTTNEQDHKNKENVQENISETTTENNENVEESIDHQEENKPDNSENLEIANLENFINNSYLTKPPKETNKEHLLFLFRSGISGILWVGFWLLHDLKKSHQWFRKK